MDSKIAICDESEEETITFLVVQWLRLHLTAGGVGFNPWAGSEGSTFLAAKTLRNRSNSVTNSIKTENKKKFVSEKKKRVSQQKTRIKRKQRCSEPLRQWLGSRLIR